MTTAKVNTTVVQFKQTYTCRRCKINFDTKREQLLHRKEAHENNSEEHKWMCKICNKGFSNAGNLDRHTKIHDNIRPFACTICDKTFAQSTNLARHISTHNGDRPFVCEVCNKSFTQTGNLKRHQLIHTGEKPFRCKRCGRSFSQRTNLKKHVMAHQGFRPYWCEICDKTFIQSQNFKTHMSKCHQIDSIKQKPIDVEVDVDVEEEQIMQENDIKAEQELYYECAVCGVMFTTFDEYQTHDVFCEVGNKEQIEIDNQRTTINFIANQFQQ